MCVMAQMVNFLAADAKVAGSRLSIYFFENLDIEYLKDSWNNIPLFFFDFDDILHESYHKRN